MMIQALQELVTQQPEFEPELTVVGTTSGGMSYGEEYYRSLRGAGSAACAVVDRQLHAAKAVMDAQAAFGFSPVSGDRQRLRFRDKRGRPRI